MEVKAGDCVFHLRGSSKELASFVGYSFASTDGFQTKKRPPDPRDWAYASSFLRADLVEYTPFYEPINLASLFEAKRRELEEYFDKNKARGARKRRIFYVKQSGRLQCLNGAYLSELEEELLEILFVTHPNSPGEIEEGLGNVPTGTQISSVKSRIGQQRFSRKVKELYGNSCCFPGCNVKDPRFLVGSHIARWSDNMELRGDLGNGLCFCVHHDRAFEVGLFTLDEQLRVFVNPKERSSESNLIVELLRQHGQPIREASVPPSIDSLLEHWIRVGMEP